MLCGSARNQDLANVPEYAFFVLLGLLILGEVKEFKELYIHPGQVSGRVHIVCAAPFWLGFIYAACSGHGITEWTRPGAAHDREHRAGALPSSPAPH
eukprot:COSAG01_NODE_24288_length_784_cov_0.816058_2_plen_96_part_01